MPKLTRLEFLEKFSAKYFALSDAEDNTSRSLNREGIADLSLLKLYFRFRKFILLVKMKKVISRNYDSSSQAAKNHGDEWGLTWYFNSNLNQLTRFGSIRSTPMDYLSNDHRDRPNQQENSHKLCNEVGILLWIWWKVNSDWDNNMIRISQSKESNCRTNTPDKEGDQ